ncbi:hypothetical protein DFA_10879 [Cavenderia fasciculata]|uniref:Uncharacterized protein n=1 Tax=Cavenderia fasciculata TaxID=261658 RepID=F4QBN3_CACFS|nr:uncharacterized protein DFA_10879 [Cavenderia fasciculata]EGG14621.1 hypothetical protein DFA_10879 [Cavenderia fasciculata]|eukprot:XP_004351129.1 hypothetical protein DFA_10879 [Cavenderia fasciculata]
MSQPFTCWVELSNNKDELTFNDITNYNRLIPTIRASKQLATGDNPIHLFSDQARTIQLDPEIAVNTTLTRIYISTQPQAQAFTLGANLGNLQSEDVLEKSCFINRKKEIKLISQSFLRILSARNYSSGDLNNANRQNMPIVVSCQMWGSGKTSLGQQYLREIRRNVQLQEEIKSDWEKVVETTIVPSHANAFDTLLSLKPLYIDLRDVKVPDVTLWNLAIANAILRVLAYSRNEAYTSINHIDQLIGKHHLKEYFIHLDEIDTRPRAVGPHVGACLHLGTIFTSLSSQPTQLCPSSAYIVKRFAFNRNKIEDENIKFFTNLIYKLTLGAPRLVQACVDYLMSVKEDLSLFNEQKILESVETGFPQEIDPTYNFSQSKRELYISLCFATLFNIPIQLDRTIKKSTWDLDESTMHTSIDLIKSFNVYIKPVDSLRRTVYIQVPPLTISHIIKNNSGPKELIDTVTMFTRLWSNEIVTGMPLERVLACSIIFKSQQCAAFYGQTFDLKLLFPFLPNVFNSKTEPIKVCKFPIFRSKSIAYAPEVIKNLIQKDAKGNCKEKMAPVSAFWSIQEMAVDHTLYMCGPKSSSSDFYLTVNRTLFCFVVKNRINSAQLDKERKKAFKNSNQREVFVDHIIIIVVALIRDPSINGTPDRDGWSICQDYKTAKSTS